MEPYSSAPAAEQDFCYLSIADAKNDIPAELSTAADRHKLQQIIQYINNAPVMPGSSTDFIAIAALLAQLNDKRAALTVIDKGLKLYPYGIELLAWALHYAAACNQLEKCEDYFSTATKRPFPLWTWHMFWEVNQYFLSLIDKSQSMENLNIVFDRAINMCKDFQRYFPNDERSYLAESSVYLSRLETTKAREILKEAIFEKPTINAPQCCLQYATLLLNDGCYEELIKVARKGLEHTAFSADAGQAGYFCYLSALAKDILIHKSNDFSNEQKIISALSDYKLAASLPGNSKYSEAIDIRSSILNARQQAAKQQQAATSAKINAPTQSLY